MITSHHQEFKTQHCGFYGVGSYRNTPDSSNWHSYILQLKQPPWSVVPITWSRPLVPLTWSRRRDPATLHLVPSTAFNKAFPCTSPPPLPPTSFDKLIQAQVR